MQIEKNDDLLWGVEAIAGYIGRTRRQTYHCLQNKFIRATKVGAIWVGSKRKISERLSGGEDESYRAVAIRHGGGRSA